jgi:polyhydroxybutyrate depolymerase
VDGCSGEPTTTTLPNRDDDGTSVKKTTVSGCKQGAELAFYEIAGGGHTWPPNEFKSFILNHMAGKSSKNIDATQVIWEFFSRHPKQ